MAAHQSFIQKTKDVLSSGVVLLPSCYFGGHTLRFIDRFIHLVQRLKQ